jgi:hypothetical protein
MTFRDCWNCNPKINKNAIGNGRIKFPSWEEDCCICEGKGKFDWFNASIMWLFELIKFGDNYEW